jgi:hypothetical protein
MKFRETSRRSSIQKKKKAKNNKAHQSWFIAKFFSCKRCQKGNSTIVCQRGIISLYQNRSCHFLKKGSNFSLWSFCKYPFRQIFILLCVYVYHSFIWLTLLSLQISPALLVGGQQENLILMWVNWALCLAQVTCSSPSSGNSPGNIRKIITVKDFRWNMEILFHTGLCSKHLFFCNTGFELQSS